MSIIETYRPNYTPEQAQRLARTLYGITAAARPLPSERDQNFRLALPGSDGFVLKISSARESRPVLQFEIDAITHLRGDSQLAPLIPELIPTREGQPIGAHGGHMIRLLRFLPGITWVQRENHPTALRRALGAFLGRIDSRFMSFPHPGRERTFDWDLANADTVIQAHIESIPDGGQRRLAARFLSLYQQEAMPHFPRLRRSVIHNDANDHNLLVSPAGELAGLIDFGDMHHSITIAELAIALAYAMQGAADPLAYAAPIVAGYHQQLPLTDLELALLYPLIAARLVTSVSLSAYRSSRTPGNPYLTVSEQPAWELLEKLAAAGPDKAAAAFRAA